MKAREPETRISAIVTIGAVMSWALYLGHNGVMLATALAAIAGISGYTLGEERAKQAQRAMSDAMSGDSDE